MMWRARRAVAVGLAAGWWLAGGAGLRAADFPSGLVLHYSFDDGGSGGVVLDRSAQHVPARVMGARWTSAGRQGGGFDFAATNSAIVVSNAPALNPPQFTLALWFKTAKADASRRWLLEKSAARGYALSLGGGPAEDGHRGKLCFTMRGREIWSDRNVADGAWHHAAARYDGAQLLLYVDGLRQQQAADGRGEPAAAAHDLTLGRRPSPEASAEQGLSFEGTLDEVMLFNRPLTEAEIQSVIAATKPRFTPQQVAWRLKELKGLYDRGLLRKDFYDRKVKECETQ